MVHVQGGPPPPHPLPAALSQPLPVRHPPLEPSSSTSPLPVSIPPFPDSLEQVSHLLRAVLAGRPAGILRKRSDPPVSPPGAPGFSQHSLKGSHRPGSTRTPCGDRSPLPREVFKPRLKHSLRISRKSGKGSSGRKPTHSRRARAGRWSWRGSGLILIGDH